MWWLGRETMLWAWTHGTCAAAILEVPWWDHALSGETQSCFPKREMHNLCFHKCFYHEKHSCAFLEGKSHHVLPKNFVFGFRVFFWGVWTFSCCQFFLLFFYFFCFFFFSGFFSKKYISKPVNMSSSFEDVNTRNLTMKMVHDLGALFNTKFARKPFCKHEYTKWRENSLVATSDAHATCHFFLKKKMQCATCQHGRRWNDLCKGYI